MDDKITLELLKRRLGEIMLKEDERYFDASGHGAGEGPNEYGKLNDPGGAGASKETEECLTSEKLSKLIEKTEEDEKNA